MVGIFPHDNLFYLSSTLVESLLTIFFYLSSTLVESPSNNLLLPFKYPVVLLLPFNVFLPYVDYHLLCQG